MKLTTSLKRDLIDKITVLDERIETHKTFNLILGSLCAILSVTTAGAVSIIIYLLLWGPR